MIPADLAARLRLLSEASFFSADQPVAGLQRAREIQADLPTLAPGQRVLATLQRALPDGTFRALIAGQQMTLSLNTPADVGDTLDLVVTETTPRAVFARLATPDAAMQGNTSALPSLSQTGRLISFLLTGQPASAPAALAAEEPILNAPPASAAQLAPALREAVGRSGLFYESHQLQWALGKLDLASLMQEPQNRPAATAGGNEGTVARPTPERAATAAPQAEGRAAPQTRATPAEQPAATAQRAAVAAEEPAVTRSMAIPERLLPVVHQQLDALATQQYVWHGQVWPGQEIEWIIHDPDDEDGAREQADGAGSAPEWKTTLRLTLPRLGGVEAQLHLTPAGVALRMRADDPAAIAALNERSGELRSALDAADLPLTGMVVELR